MQLRRLPNCQGAKSKGVSFVNYTQCYKQPPPFFSSSIFKYFGSDAKRKKKRGKENNLHTIITVGRADVCLDDNISIGGGLHDTEDNS